MSKVTGNSKEKYPLSTVIVSRRVEIVTQSIGDLLIQYYTRTVH